MFLLHADEQYFDVLNILSEITAVVSMVIKKSGIVFYTDNLSLPGCAVQANWKTAKQQNSKTKRAVLHLLS